MSATVTTAVADLQLLSAEPGGTAVLAYMPEPDAEAVTVTMPHEVWVAMGNPNSFALTLETKCDGCGCTDSQGCFTGCTWAAPGLCSECV